MLPPLTRRKWLVLGLAVVLPAAVLLGWQGRRWQARRAAERARQPAPLAQLSRCRKASTLSLDTRLPAADWGEVGPLQLARRVGAMGGFDCIAFAPRSLDLGRMAPRGDDYRYGAPNQGKTVREVLALGEKQFKQLQSEPHQSWLLLFFGSKEELERTRGAADEVPPLVVWARGSYNLLSLLAEVWRLRISVEPALLDRMDRLVAEGDKRLKERRRGYEALRMEEPASFWQVPYGAGYDSESYGDPSTTGTRGVSFLVMRPTRLAEVMQRAAATLGGECRLEGGIWVFRRRIDGRQIKEDVERLVSDISPDHPQIDADTFRSLLAVGEPAVPALTKLLDPAHPEVCAGVAALLAEMKATDGVPRLLEVWRKVKKPAGYDASSPRAAILVALGKLGDRRAIEALVKAARDPEEQAPARMAARQALAQIGALDALAADAGRALPPWHKRFRLKLLAHKQQEQPPAPGTCWLLAQCLDDKKQHWAFFCSGCLGDPRDLWLASSPDGSDWRDFTFTGCATEYPANYYGGQRGQKYAIAVAGDDVTLTWPNLSGRTSVPKREKVNGKWRITYRPVVPAPIVKKLKLSDLLRDSDQDGLTDAVEARLGTDPKKADSDGDGLADGRDANPLAAPLKKPGDREVLLQLLFTSLFGGDPEPDVLGVQLAKPAGELLGCGGPVIPLYENAPADRLQQLAQGRILSFGGPTSGENGVLAVDPPVAFNDSRTRAQIIFWLSGQPGYSSYYGSGPGGEQIALFAKQQGKWRLTRIARFDWGSKGSPRPSYW